MKNYINEFGRDVALDGEWEMGYSATEKNIKELKFTYARKNSNKSCKISFRADIAAPQPIFWKYYLQCWVDGELKLNSRIKEEVYNTFRKNQNPEMLCAGLEYFLYYEYVSALKKTKVSSKTKKVVSQKKIVKSSYLVDILFEEEQIIEEDLFNKTDIQNSEIRPEQLLINIL